MDDIKSIWDLKEYKPLYEAFLNRQQRLQHLEKYYKGGMYGVSPALGQAWHAKLPVKSLQRRVKALFQPLAQAVRTDVALIPGGWLAENANFQPAIDAVLKSSRWQVEQDMYLTNAASMGQATLKIVDDPINQQVIIQPIRPDMVLPVPVSDYDPTLAMAIIVGNSAGKEIAEVITPELIATFVNGQPMGQGGREAVFVNPLGEVGVVDVPFIYNGAQLGESTYQDAIVPLNEINSQATNLDKLIEQHIEPQWAAFIENPEQNAADLQKSGHNVWWLPNGSSMQALVATLDIDGVMKLITEVKDEMKETMPELLIYKLVGLNRLAVPGLEIQLLPLTIKIHRARRTVDDGIERALRMVGRAYKLMETNPDLQALDNPQLALNEKRPVIYLDALSSLNLKQAELGVQAQQLNIQQLQALQGDGMSNG